MSVPAARAAARGDVPASGRSGYQVGYRTFEAFLAGRIDRVRVQRLTDRLCLLRRDFRPKSDANRQAPERRRGSRDSEAGRTAPLTLWFPAGGVSVCHASEGAEIVRVVIPITITRWVIPPISQRQLSSFCKRCREEEGFEKEASLRLATLHRVLVLAVAGGCKSFGQAGEEWGRRGILCTLRGLL